MLGIILDAVKESAYFGLLAIAWGVLVPVALWGGLWGAANAPGPWIVAAVILLGVPVASIWLGLRVLGNPITKFITSVRADIERFS